MNKNKIAIFASGSGSNAENISRFFSQHPSIEVSLFLTNKPDAAVIGRAKNLGIPCHIFNREEFYDTNSIPELLKSKSIDLIVLAGFLWLIPSNLIQNYPNRIINIHPALLPKYGGKGMYGSKVHQQVIENKETKSGITIHFVNEKYDEGNTIFQATCSISGDDNADTLANKVHALEYEHFPKVIESVILKL